MAINTGDKIVLDHGTGAKLSHDLIALITETLGDVYVGKMEDSAVLPVPGDKIAVTTDSFVVTPIFFGNGDIGKISICGTVNDLAVSGAKPVYLTLAMVLETGFPLSDLKKILESIRKTAQEADIKIVAGDTKVVNVGEIDKICINTSGIGVFERKPLNCYAIEPGDKVILSGHIGNHSIHLLSVRVGLGYEQRVLSDCAPLNGLIAGVLAGTPEGGVKAIRDVTRGGLSSVLNEFSQSSRLSIVVEEEKLPILPETAMAANMLGIDPIHLANEGCICLFVKPEEESRVLDLLKRHPYGTNAVVIGYTRTGADVEMVRGDGTVKILEELIGMELPRLC